MKPSGGSPILLHNIFVIINILVTCLGIELLAGHLQIINLPSLIFGFPK